MMVDLKGRARHLARRFGYDIVPYSGRTGRRRMPPDFQDHDIAICDAVEPYTMTSPESVFALRHAVQYVVESGIPGAFVECGVWKGGSMMAVALTLDRLGCRDRDLYLFDTFEGMPPAEDVDVSVHGWSGVEEFKRHQTGEGSSSWCLATEEEVRQAMTSTGYPHDLLHYVRGRVQDTLPHAAPREIALLRLDTDWYASTAHELEHLYPRLSRAGVLIVDDYGQWKGQRQAVDEYVSRHQLRLLLNRIDFTARIAVKQA